MNNAWISTLRTENNIFRGQDMIKDAIDNLRRSVYES